MVKAMTWFSRKHRVRDEDLGVVTAHAWADAARELEQLRMSTAAGLEQLRADSASATTKTGWDKAGILIQAFGASAIIVSIIALFVGVRQFDVQQKTNAMDMLEQQQNNAAATLDQQRQATLSGYLDDMSVLVLQYNLPKSKPGAPVRAIAVARTLTAVRDLDGVRKGTLIRYLWEAGLLARPQPIVDISGADLTGAVFSNADLDKVVLSQLKLNNAQFVRYTTLVNADLSDSDLYKADLTNAILNHANLRNSNPIGAHLSGAYLIGADLAGADLTGADLAGADLAGVNLKGARYNSTLEYVRNPQGKLVLEGPTRWPRGVNPRAEGADCYTCSARR